MVRKIHDPGEAGLRDPETVRTFLRDLRDQDVSLRVSPADRVRTALEHGTPDRVPFDYWAVPETEKKLLAFLDLPENPAGREELLALLRIDIRTLAPEYAGTPPEELPDGSFYTDLGSHRRKVKNEFSVYDEYASFPLSHAESAEEVETWPLWPKTANYDWTGLSRTASGIIAEKGPYLRYDVGGIFESAWALYGLDRFLMDLIDKPEIPLKIMDCYTDFFIENVRALADAAGDQISLLYTYDDVATQSGLLMSPSMWRRHILPRHQRLNTEIKKHGYKIMYHSCGSVFPLIGEFIREMHIDVLNPLQPRAAGMDMMKIKKEFGQSVSFHGAVDIQQTLPFGTAADVRNEVLERCRVLGRGGGYIAASAHYIQADVPLENIFSLYTADRHVPG